MVRRVEPVGSESEPERRASEVGEGFFLAVEVPGNIIEVESFGQVEKGVGVKAVDEAAAVVFEVALDFETAEKVEEAIPCGKTTTELQVHGGIGKKRDVPDRSGQRKTVGRRMLGLVVAFFPHRIVVDP